MRTNLLLAFALLTAIACVPKRDLQAPEIQQLPDLEKVMDVQATVADPQFKKIDQGSYTDADWAAFADVGARIQVTSVKSKDFSKGAEFNVFADRLHDKAAALATAAAAKDAAAASKALAEMKATCKECHSKFK